MQIRSITSTNNYLNDMYLKLNNQFELKRIKMKMTIRYIAAFIFALTLIVMHTSCSKDDDEGTPRIDYIRITDPDSSDSLLVSAGQGHMIAIIGENLSGAEAIIFNNVVASLTSTYITNTSIIVNVPTEVPTEVTNTFTIYFANGETLTHDFIVSINKPSVTGMMCEYVNDGGTAVIYGNYFYEPLTVIFPGDLEATINTVADDNTSITVIVPEGTEPGHIAVKSNFGIGQSTFKFRDDRNIVISSDPFTGWWNADFVVSNPGADDPELINGNYIRVNKQIGAWGWTEVAGGPASAMGDISKNIPDDAILHPELYSCKFEMNTLKPFNGSSIRLNFGLNSENNDAYLFNPPYDTEGKWETISIPFEEMVKAYKDNGSTVEVNHDGYWSRVLIFGGTALDCDICFDNFRIVPNRY